MVEYAKLAFSALILTAASLRQRARELLPIAAMLVLVLLDNSLTWHQQMGLRLVPANRHIVEALYFAVIGAVLLAAGWIIFLAAAWFRRPEVLAIALVTGALGFFAVAVDALHVPISSFLPRLDRWLAILEDGGELLTLSVLLAVCLAIGRNAGATERMVRNRT